MKRLSALLTFALAFSITAMAFAASYTLTVTTDKAAYTPGQTIVTTAIFKKDGTVITSPGTREIRIKDSSGSELIKTSMSSAGSGTYKYSYKLSNSAKTGKYEVRAKFSSGDNEVKGYTYPQVNTIVAVDSTAPATAVSPAAGTYTMPISITLTANETATIYYTVNGTTPTTASTRYTAPISLTGTTTLKYFARDTAGNNETVKTATFTAGTTPPPPPTTGSHASLTYTGATMCLQCHAAQAAGMAGSVHYKWEGPNSQISNKPGVTGGKLNSAVNAYCINILGNWNGCGSCHIGAGAKPGTVADATQNIDCLVCHQKGYKRVRNSVTGLFDPDPTKMTITMDVAVQTVHKPVKSNCLQCHAKGGGGDALKRGDMALINGTTTDRNYDVHMATTGANLACQQCHTYTNHKVAGRGSDLRPTDNAVAVNCATSTCHTTKATLTAGHATTDINKHMKRVACQTCHIPVYGKMAADAVVDPLTGFGDQKTETTRTWATPEWSVLNNRWEPTIVKANNLKPVYAFFDGTSWVSDLYDVAVIDPATGAYKISRPNGGINSTNSKLTPFKYKTSTQPLHTASGKLIAVNTALYFKNNDVAAAILSGMTNMGFSTADAYSMVTTDEYQMLNHTVTPKTSALACTSCHGTTATQMNLKTLGYVLKNTEAVVCIQCHSKKTNPGYMSVHSKHVASEGYDCSLCHNFSRPERNLKMTN